MSRPGRRVYFGKEDVPEVLAGLGTSILTTSRGVMTGRAAVKAGVGGEVLCVYQMLQSTSPPTPAFTAARPVITPRDVVRMLVPRPASTSGTSSRPK